MTESAGSLSGVRVLEFSLVYAAPWAGMTLADMGAEVIKVEPPGGEPIRSAAAVLPNAGGKMFTWVNRGKRSLVLDLRDERGREVIQRLAPEIDVVLINYRPGVAQRFGIDYESLSAINPALIYAEITGFGSDGPLAGQGSSDIIGQSYGGMTAAVGKLDPYGAPWTMNIGMADVTGGAAAVLGVVSALFARDAGAPGQRIEVSLLRTVMAASGWLNMRDETTDPLDVSPLRERMRELAAGGVAYDDLLAERRAVRGAGRSPYLASYATDDGAISLGCVTAEQEARLRGALGIEEGESDPTAVEEQIRAALQGESSEHWLALLEREGVPAAPVSIPELLHRDPQAEHLMVDVEHPLLGGQRQVAPLIDLSETPTRPAAPAALLGEHGEEILAGLGYAPKEIAELRASKVLG